MPVIWEILQFVGEAVAHTWPFFALSVVLAALVQALELDGLIRRVFDERVGVAILLATLVGAFSPFCSCTVVPIIAGLLASGVPLAPVMAFWIASPTMDPEIFALSVGILGWPLAWMRLAATLALSLGAGYVTLALTRTRWLAPAPGREAREEVACCAPARSMPLPVVNQQALAVAGGGGGGCAGATCALPADTTTSSSPPWLNQLQASVRHLDWTDVGRDVRRQSWELGRWLLLAFVLEALITQFVPQEAIVTVLGSHNPLAVPLAALIGIPLYLSNITALPIVAGLLGQGMQAGAAVAFLIAGPVTTIPALTAVWGVVQRRVFALYLALGLLGAMALGLLANLLL